MTSIACGAPFAAWWISSPRPRLGPRDDVQCPAYSLTIGKEDARERAYAERDAEIIRGAARRARGAGRRASG
jgi:hypothetical protein